MVSQCPVTVESYSVGNEIRTTALFTNLADPEQYPFDPTVVRCDVTTPSGVLTTYQYPEGSEIFNDDIGSYYLPLLLDETGHWLVRWWSEGNATTSSQILIRATQ